MELLLGLVRRHELSLLWVTHSAELAALADRTLVMREGALHEAGRCPACCTSPAGDITAATSPRVG